MAVTAASLDAVEWIAHTFAPPRLTAWGMTTIAADLAASPTISNTNRLNAAINYMAAREAEVWAAYVPAWDVWWQQAGDAVATDFVGSMSGVAFDALMVDPDQTAKRALKTFLRTLELLYFQHLAVG